MNANQKLSSFSHFKHIRAFRNYLGAMEKDIKALGCSDYSIDITSPGSPKSILAKIFSGPDFNHAEEILLVSMEIFGCPVNILLPISAFNVEMPYLLDVEFPVAMTGRAEYKHDTFGEHWHYTPKNKQREIELKHTLPKISMQQNVYRMGVQYQIKIGQTLEPAADNNTHWIIQSGYEGGLFTGGYRPQIKKYLSEIPKVEALLRKWALD